MDVDSFENPLGDVGGRGALADVEAALACGGAEVSHAAVGAMAQLLAERDAKARSSGATARTSAAKSGLSDLIGFGSGARSVVRRLHRRL